MHSRRPAAMPYCRNSMLRHANSRELVCRTLILQDVPRVAVVVAVAHSADQSEKHDAERHAQEM